MTASAAFLVIFHLLLCFFFFRAVYQTRALCQKPNTRDLMAAFVFFVLAAGYMWLAVHQSSWLFFLFVVELMLSMLDLAELHIL